MNDAIAYRTKEELEAGLDAIRQSPKDDGVLQMIVRRPDVGAREVLEHGELDVVAGLVGDTWQTRASRKTRDGSPHPGMQINIMNARVAQLLAQDRSRWPLAGDQLFVDMDLSEASLPAGTRLAVGTAVLEVSPEPHTGCSKFVSRFGLDATAFVNSGVGRELHLRGINAKVVTSGVIRVGDAVSKIRA